MFHIYTDKQRVTHNPVSYNHIITHLFRYASIDWQKLSTLPLGGCYRFENHSIVRMV